MITRPPRPSSRAALLVRGTGMVGAALAVGLTLAACGSGGAAGPAPTATSGTTQAPDDAGAARAGAAQQFPGASGEVAAVTGDIAQVQGGGSQTAVTWTAATVVTRQVAGTLADVTVGSCVSAFAASGDASSDESAAVAATTVTVTPAGDDGTCARGGAGGRGPGSSADGRQVPDGVPSGFPTDRPSDLPSDMPSGFPGGGDGAGRRGFAAGVFGTVTAVSATGFTVEQTAFAGPGGQDASAQPATTTRDVTVAADTTYTTTQTADTSAIAVGQCLTAVGTEDGSGTITADTIALSAKGEDGCTSRFGGGRSGQGGFPGGGQGRSTAQGGGNA
ncbi:hypothetical protein [Xylanimonas protaetiae]|uniref:DUF5666 domain-containing protein n=1 Tax=Xylanimonas protaetiae TaxID=2509457 RepID=A0A4P6F2Q4_9MICO|nr:hypothetical protein [Xylanimonas protaetiae]QAY69794.1 hypothetical protein ET471_06880 [Xylanimonas protaetiae]